MSRSKASIKRARALATLRQRRWRERHPEETRASAIEWQRSWREEQYAAGLHFVNGKPTDAARRKRAPGEEPPHGTEHRYNWRRDPCRCADCVRASSAARLARKHARRSAR
jgi:hypothetical protein